MPWRDVLGLQQYLGGMSQSNNHMNAEFTAFVFFQISDTQKKPQLFTII